MKWFAKQGNSDRFDKLKTAVVEIVHSELSHKTLTEEAGERVAAERPLLFLTYGAFLLYLTGMALAEVIKLQEDCDSNLDGVVDLMTKQEWWEEKPFFLIFDQMGESLRSALSPGADAALDPSIRMVEAATRAGYSLQYSTRLGFIYHVAFSLPNHFKSVKLLAYDAIHKR
jgi:hypothetical protein